jgi:hypothetical protein
MKLQRHAADRPLLSSRRAGSFANGGHSHNFGRVQVINRLPSKIQPRLAVSQPGDHFEEEADRVAQRVTNGSAATALNHEHVTGRIEPQIQRVPADETIEPPQNEGVPESAEPSGPDAPEASADKVSGKSGLIVEDELPDLGPGQMYKGEFLDELQTSVCATADAELAIVGRNTDGCPYIEQWIGYYRTKSSQYLERAIRRYAPQTASMTAAQDYIPLIAAQVRRAVAVWATTGEITGVPEGISSASSPGTGGPGENRNAAATPGAQLKSRGDGAGVVKDARAIQSRLGPGVALDGVVKSRMASAFGYDFSRVRVHTDAQAAGISSGLNARAFTLGSNVGFASGEYRPGTLIGDALIAHELAHVVQQGGTEPAPMHKGGSEYDGLEDDADRSAVGAVVSLWGGVKNGLAKLSSNTVPRLQTGLRLQGCSDTSAPKGRIIIVTSNVTPKIYGNCGQFLWLTNWTTSGRNGFIVQEIVNTYSARDCTGAADTDTATVPTPHFYEAWKVDARGNTTPELVTPDGRFNDKWSRRERADSNGTPGSQGEWSTSGKAYWAASLDPAASFTVGAVYDAHDLPSTTKRPANLGTSLDDRQVGGRWNCCGGVQTHEPT